jgi:ElaB/YqjD/DUF883 family membrane-anchored ribosome-binding protein
MRLADVSSRLAEVPGRVSEVAERYQVPERVSEASRKVYQGMTLAGEAARRGANVAYRLAREHPRTSIGATIAAGLLIGGLLWYMFGDSKHPVQRRRTPTRARAGTERRKRARAAGARG